MRLRRLRCEVPFDVVVSDVLPWPTAIETIGVIHDLRHDESGNWLHRRVYRHYLLQGLRRARRVHAVSESTMQALHTRWNDAELGNSLVIRNGLDQAIFHARPSEQDSFVLRKWNLGKPFVLWVGHLEERKDPILPLAIREWELRNGIMEDRPIVFVGQGALDMAGRIRALEKSFPMMDVARLISGCGDEDLAALYRNAQATLVTSHLEGFSLIPLEAMGCGCPLIVSDLPAHRELLEGSATILRTRDPAEWGRALLTLTSAPKLPPGSVDERVLASLSWDAAAIAFATDVRSLLST